MAKKSTARKSSGAGSRRDSGLTRRHFLGGSAAAGAAIGTGVETKAAAAKPKTIGPRKASITLNVNGKDYRLSVEPRVTLVRALRNHLDLTGTKEICNGGACGGCNVVVDGNLVNSCMMLALDAVGKTITTVEGIAKGDKLDPIQEAFVKYDALQCGFCTPGMVVACRALLDKNKTPSLYEIKRGLSGNLCRCGTYPRIFQAVQAAAKNA